MRPERTWRAAPVRQLLKMLASEDIDRATFKQLTKHVVGCDEEVPIDMTEARPASCGDRGASTGDRCSGNRPSCRGRHPDRRGGEQ